ncbi:MAG: cob(I)yrinic acid a,c-diamide adenosyltransferase [Gammaproteobacteria bacterium]|nr:cob(I)yrinic acid a,c-diamide adenosyltransferase [Gammaproteobacteria bacterium]MDH5660125.1 cob(I)yrinic acid a,c-diamide adenosyltransferase [Gammaproteobacteria bacterium]
MTEQDKNKRHEARMAKKKEIIDEKIKKADKEQGVIVITTGNGKGKSSSGFGMVARALGHGMKVGIIQFIKGAFSTGEESFFRRFPDEVEYHVMGDGFTWETQNRDQDVKTATLAWEKAKRMLNDESYDLILLDELNIVLKYQYLPIDEVIKDLQNRPIMQHVVITGRAAKDELIEIADTVTEMKDVKHAFRSGIKAQKGIEL